MSMSFQCSPLPPEKVAGQDLAQCVGGHRSMAYIYNFMEPMDGNDKVRCLKCSKEISIL